MRGKQFIPTQIRRIEALVMAVVMLFTAFTIPVSAEQQEDSVINLLKEGTPGEETPTGNEIVSFAAATVKDKELVRNQYNTVEEYIEDYYFINELTSQIGNQPLDGNNWELQVELKVTEFNGNSLNMMLFKSGKDGENWTTTEAAAYDGSKDTVCSLTIGLSDFAELGQLGLRLATGEAGSTVSYEIVSAKVVRKEGSGTSGSTGGDTAKNLVADYGAVASKTEKFSPNAPDYMSQFIVNHYFINGLTDKVEGQNVAGNNWELQVEVKVTDYSGDKNKLEMFLFAMDENYTNWGEGARKKLSGEDSYMLTYDLSKHSNFQQLGLRFFQEENADNEITYEVLSAKIVSQGEKEPELEDSELTDFNETLDEGNWHDKKQVTVAENIYVPGQFLIKHQFRNIPHDLSMGGLGGFEALRMKVSVTVHSYTKGDNSNAEALIYAMDGSYENWKQNQILLKGDGSEQTVDITLDLAQCYMLHPRESLGEIGFEITGLKDGTPVEYTINDARIIGKGAANQILTNIELKDEYKLTGEVKHVSYANTPVGKHGKLSVQKVEGYSAPVVVDKNGEPYQLRGASSHGLSWFPEYVNEDAYRSLRDEWGMNMVRIAIYPREGEYGYISDKLGPSKENAAAYNDALIMKGVEAAKKLGMYVMIDWHVLDYNPNRDTTEATAFFQKYAQLYKDYDNVLFEICNEPAGTKWYNGDGVGNDLYTYCKTVTQAIRDKGNDAIVICGTNNFSQDVHEVADKPLSEDGFKNIMYTCHFYAATHYDTQFNRLKNAVESGIPVFITEFGICTASGDGYYDTDAADKWLDYCEEHGMGYSCWAMSNSTESAAYFKTTCTKTSGWTEGDLTVTSTYLVNRCNDTAKKLNDAVGFSLESEGAHTYTKEVTKAATCTEAGVSTFTCSCGYSYTEPIAATGHSKEIRNSKTATCKEEGYTGDTYCKKCNELLIKGNIIPKTENHVWDAGVITEPAAATKDGVKTFTCTVCKTTKTEKIPATGTGTSTGTEDLIPKKGTVLKSGNNSYKVTKAGSTVSFVKTASKSTKVTIPETVKIGNITYKVTSIANNAFKNNKKVKTITIGKNVTAIGVSAFSGCKKLSKVTIGNNVTTIGKSAFYKCTSLKKITIPSKVITIGTSAFSGCNKLAAITIKSTKLKSVGKNAFKNIKSTAKIKVPSKKLKAYNKTLKKKGQSSKVKIVKM